ncbi:MAG: TrmH family RNA methyltransferase, partial [Chloroflexota bacterium]
MTDQAGAGRQLDEDGLRDFFDAQRASRNCADLPRPLVIVAGLHLPVNAGMILRVADAVNCRAVWFVDVDYPDSRRMRREMRTASRMMSDQLPNEFISLDALRDRLPDTGPLVAVEITSASTDLYRTSLPPQAAFVVGHERHGIPGPVLELCVQAVHLPML